MVTIRRHPVPADSYDPNRPLNDLLLAQLDHFKHIAKGLPAELQNTIPSEPSIEDREGVDRFIAAVTGVHVSRKKAKPLLVAKPGAKTVSRKQSVTLDLAAVAEEQPKKTGSAKSKPQANAKSKAKRGDTGGSKP
jgi:hypothetical protein